MESGLKTSMARILNENVQEVSQSQLQTAISINIRRNVRIIPPESCTKMRVNASSFMEINQNMVSAFEDMNSQTVTDNILSEAESYVRSRPGSDANFTTRSDTRQSTYNLVEEYRRMFVDQTVSAVNVQQNITLPVCVNYLNLQQTSIVNMFISILTDRLYEHLAEQPEYRRFLAPSVTPPPAPPSSVAPPPPPPPPAVQPQIDLQPQTPAETSPPPPTAKTPKTNDKPATAGDDVLVSWVMLGGGIFLFFLLLILFLPRR